VRRLANILQLGVKEIRSLWHDKVLLIFLIWSFSFGLYESANSQSSELRNAPVAVVDEDRSPLSQRLLGALRPPEFLPPRLIEFAEIDPGLDAGRYTFTLHVPAGFQRDVLAGRQPAIQLNIDATRMHQATHVSARAVPGTHEAMTTHTQSETATRREASDHASEVTHALVHVAERRHEQDHIHTDDAALIEDVGE